MGILCLFVEYVVNVIIYVIDINDCFFVFVKLLYEVFFLLLIYKGVKVIIVNVIDVDLSVFLQLIYFIIEGNIGEKFFMDYKIGVLIV